MLRCERRQGYLLTYPPARTMIITPERYQETSAYELLEQASRGRIAMDQRLVHALVDDPSRTLPDLVRWATETHDDAEFDLDDELVLLFRHLKTPESIPFFLRYLRRDPQEVAEGTVDALYAIREHAFEPLLKLYDELEEDQGSEVAFVLASFRMRDPRVLKILVDRLEFDAHEGAIALELYGDPAAAPALEKLLSELPEDEVHLRRTVQGALGELGRDDIAEETDTWELWSEFPEIALPHFENLEPAERIAYLDSADAEYRREAALSMVNEELSEQEIEALLRHGRSDEDPRVRASCWEALSDLNEEPEIAAAMKACLEDESAAAEARCGALIGLATEADQAYFRKYAELFYANDKTRAGAMKAMWHSMDHSFADKFPPHLNDADPDVQQQAIAGVGYLGVHSASEQLRPFFENEDLRPNALFAYALSVRHEVTRSRMRGLLRKVEEAAGGLSEEEERLVEVALDERLLMHGKRPMFHPERFSGMDEAVAFPEENEGASPVAVAGSSKPGRNDPCPCGSGKKYKKCCGAG